MAGGDEAIKQTGLSLQVDDLGRACEHVGAQGGTINEPPTNRSGEPIRLAVIADNEGNRLMLAQYVG